MSANPYGVGVRKLVGSEHTYRVREGDYRIIMFMIRQTSYTYGMHGLSLWILASDVKRFQPLIVFNGVAFLLAAPAFLTREVTKLVRLISS